MGASVLAFGVGLGDRLGFLSVDVDSAFGGCGFRSLVPVGCGCLATVRCWVTALLGAGVRFGFDVSAFSADCLVGFVCYKTKISVYSFTFSNIA